MTYINKYSKVNIEKTNNRGRWLIFALIIPMLTQNYYDILSIFEGESLALHTYQGPLVMKLGKDICYFLILLAIGWNFKKNKRLSNPGIIALFFLLAAWLMMFSVYANGFIVALVGFRWLIPFFIFLLMGNWVKTIDRDFFVYFLSIALLGCFVVQVIQLFFMPPVFGEILPGLSARAPGYFLAPNSAAFFGCSSASLIMVVQRYRGKFTLTSILLAVCIAALAQSGTGLVVSLLLLLWYFLYPKLKVFLFVGILLTPIAFLNLNVLTQRDDYLELSGGGRLHALQNIFIESFGSITTFGKYTNAANLLSDNPYNQVAADSLVASWIGNFGIFGLLATLLIILFVIVSKAQYQRNFVVAPLIVFMLFSMTTIIFEAFPMNVILALSILWSRSISQIYKSE